MGNNSSKAAAEKEDNNKKGIKARKPEHNSYNDGENIESLSSNLAYQQGYVVKEILKEGKRAPRRIEEVEASLDVREILGGGTRATRKLEEIPRASLDVHEILTGGARATRKLDEIPQAQYELPQHSRLEDNTVSVDLWMNSWDGESQESINEDSILEWETVSEGRTIDDDEKVDHLATDEQSAWGDEMDRFEEENGDETLRGAHRRMVDDNEELDLRQIAVDGTHEEDTSSMMSLIESMPSPLKLPRRARADTSYYQTQERSSEESKSSSSKTSVAETLENKSAPKTLTRSAWVSDFDLRPHRSSEESSFLSSKTSVNEMLESNSPYQMLESNSPPMTATRNAWIAGLDLQPHERPIATPDKRKSTSALMSMSEALQMKPLGPRSPRSLRRLVRPSSFYHKRPTLAVFQEMMDENEAQGDSVNDNEVTKSATTNAFKPGALLKSTKFRSLGNLKCLKTSLSSLQLFERARGRKKIREDGAEFSEPEETVKEVVDFGLPEIPSLSLGRSFPYVTSYLALPTVEEEKCEKEEEEPVIPEGPTGHVRPPTMSPKEFNIIAWKLDQDLEEMDAGFPPYNTMSKPSTMSLIPQGTVVSIVLSKNVRTASTQSFVVGESPETDEDKEETEPCPADEDMVLAERVICWRERVAKEADYVITTGSPCEGLAEHVPGCTCVLKWSF